MDKDHVQKWHWRAIEKTVGDTQLYYQGSGVPHYFWNTDIISPDSKNNRDVLMGEALTRATTQLKSEALSNARYNLMAGGWLEFIEKTEGTFRKLPYAIKFWRINGRREIVGYDPFFFCWYVNYDLVVCRLDFVEANGSMKVKPDLFPVRDFLGRAGLDPKCPPDPQYEPYMIFHFVMNVDANELRTLLTFHYDDAGFRASVGKDTGFDMTGSPEFFDKLFDDSGEEWVIKVDERDDE